MHAFDTHKYIKKLQSRGFNERQAEMIVQAFLESKEYDLSQLASKEQVNLLAKTIEERATKEQVNALQKIMKERAIKEQVESLNKSIEDKASKAQLVSMKDEVIKKIEELQKTVITKLICLLIFFSSIIWVAIKFHC